MVSEELLTIDEAAKFLRINRRTAWRWCRSGKLPAFKMGHQWRIGKSALDRMIVQRVSKAWLHD